MQSIEQIVRFLTKYHLTLSTAESCTGGLMASLIAGIPGGGAVLHSGFVVYSSEAKQRCLGVNSGTIARFGLTSEEVASEMALGALKAGQADIAVANTGLAEADGDLDGMQCFACAMRLGAHEGVVSETLRFEGERNEVRYAAARHGLLRLPYYCERLRSS